jgi:hypothetical protein
MIKNAFAGFLVVIFPIAFVGELINMFFKSNGIYLSGNQQGVLFYCRVQNHTKIQFTCIITKQEDTS